MDASLILVYAEEYLQRRIVETRKDLKMKEEYERELKELKRFVRKGKWKEWVV